MNRISDLTKYKGTLPYASEMFGIYTPLLGWKSARKKKKIQQSFQQAKSQFLSSLTAQYEPLVKVVFNADGILEPESILPGSAKKNQLAVQSESLLLNKIAGLLEGKDRPTAADWKDLLNREALAGLLNGPGDNTVFKDIQHSHNETISGIHRITVNENESPESLERRKQDLKEQKIIITLNRLQRESVMAGLLADMGANEMIKPLEQLFYTDADAAVAQSIQTFQTLLQDDLNDPFLTFDPGENIKDVSVSPIGIVHLFRQFFFEFDTFLGSPVGHVWVSPGATVELVEVNTRKTTIEKSFETSFESSTRQESASATQDDLSNATKMDNKEDTKAGFSTTASSSYPTVSISATASLNMDSTQQISRETTQKQMRQQSNKLSAEIRQNYKSTFKTVTEVTDVSSKRYLLTNPTTDKLFNYEMRRKMRKVGVQVQDMGSYLCWETFVDEPGRELGLANLVHIAKPADLLPVPDQTMIPPLPESDSYAFIETLDWKGGDKSVPWDPATGIIWGPVCRINFPEGYELDEIANPPLAIRSDIYGVDSELTHWAFRYMIDPGKKTFRIGIFVDDSYRKVQNIPTWAAYIQYQNKGLNVNEHHDFKVSGSIRLKLSDSKRQSIADANNAKIKAGMAADKENQRRTQEAFVQAARDRVKIASNIRERNFEDLREEERIIIYRKLISALVTDSNYNLSDSAENLEPRHVFSELINSVFDIDKMLYFVAPEWWKPRKHFNQTIIPDNRPDQVFTFEKASSHLSTSFNMRVMPPFKQRAAIPKELSSSITNWSEGENRADNYYITEDSDPAKLGSSLGWLLQLDGDKHRNCFLNAPWVKAIIPIRPGKEEMALNWLQQAGVEGAEGLSATYSEQKEYPFIIQKLAGNGITSANPPTVNDAIRALCIEVKEKNQQAMIVDKFPKDPDLHNDEKVAATPVEKVFEHGFYPLQGGFRANPNPDDNDDPNNKDRYFSIFTQWMEILPTDQIVPVPVEYDPITGVMK